MNQRIRGKKAKHNGAAFEALFLNACTHKAIVCTRIPDGCRQVGQSKLIRQKTPFDWVISYKGITALIDTKSTEQERFPHSKIDPAQALKLVRHDIEGTKAGYVAWLKKSDAFIYIPAKILCTAMQHPGSIGVDHKDTILLGGLKDLDIRRLFETIQP